MSETDHLQCTDDDSAKGNSADDDLSVAPAVAAEQPDRGRHADRPSEVPPKGWKDVAVRVRSEAKDDHVPLLAAGVSFYALLAVGPALAALISLYGLIADPDKIRGELVDALAAAPREVRELLIVQMETIAQASKGQGLLVAILGLVIALWSASAGVGHLMEALNVAYDEQDGRGFLRRRVLALAFTLGAVLFAAVSLGGITLLPGFVADLGLSGIARWLIGAVRWLGLFAGMVTALSVLYRHGPDRDVPRWKWASPGAFFAATLWIVGSFGLSLYTANFAKYDETYGVLGAVVVVMLWVYVTAVAIVLGAELNAELERQTLNDTTVGPSRPLGARGAYAADTVGQSAGK